MMFNLTKRTYKINIETIWDDCCYLDIDGLTGEENFILEEQSSGSARFSDVELREDLLEEIRVSFKIPEDYTMNGNIYGDLVHGEGQVGRKLRSRSFELNILGEAHKLVLGNVQTESIVVSNKEGLVSLAGLTVQKGVIKSRQIESKKLMTSETINLEADNISIRSLQMFGPSKGFLKAKKT